MKSAMGKNNFDRLEQAATMGSPTLDAAQIRAKLETRIIRLGEVLGSLQAMRQELIKLPVSGDKAKMKMLTAARIQVNDLYENKVFKLPVGTKQPLKKVLNELTSMREGVLTKASISDKAFKLVTARQAEKEIEALIVTAKDRLIRLEADAFDMEKFIGEVHDVIKKNKDEVSKLQGIKTKPFVFARVPVVPIAQGISISRLQNNGFSVDNLAGYPSIDKQLVIGINPKLSFTDLGNKTVKDEQGNKTKQKVSIGEISGAKTRALVRTEAKNLVKMLEKQLKTKLYFVTEDPFDKVGGIWFWVMTENDMNRFKKAFPSSNQKISQWGFSF